MKAKTLLLAVLAIIFSISASGQRERWTLLGERLVNDRVDHDIIPVTVLKGDFKAVQFRVKGASVDFHKVVIVYGNGNRQEVELRHSIPAGGMTRAIDLAGNERIIKEIHFWYDANTIRGRKALVRVFGKG